MEESSEQLQDTGHDSIKVEHTYDDLMAQFEAKGVSQEVLIHLSELVGGILQIDSEKEQLISELNDEGNHELNEIKPEKSGARQFLG